LDLKQPRIKNYDIGGQGGEAPRKPFCFLGGGGENFENLSCININVFFDHFCESLKKREVKV